MSGRRVSALPFAISALAATVLLVVIVVAVLLSPDSDTTTNSLVNAPTSLESCAAFGVVRRSCDGSDHETQHWRGTARSNFLYLAPRSTPEQLAARPNARVVSNALCAQPPHVGKSVVWSSLIWSFGQFLDHAITRVAQSQNAEDAVHINVTGDSTFDPLSEGAEIASGGVLPHNLITHFVDGNVLYGSDVDTLVSLRAWEGGRLSMHEDALPPQAEGGGARRVGDVRGNEHPVLLALHTLLVLEHNYQAGRLATGHPTWNDECLFNAARTIVESEVRHIVFSDFVPALLGEQLPPPAFNGSCHVEIAAEFAGSAYRLHSLVSEALPAYNTESGEHIESLALKNAFDKNDFLEKHGVGALLLGQVKTKSEKLDLHMVDSLRQHLFPGAGVPLDLAAINIERGRRLNLSDFSALRKAYRPDVGHLDKWADLGASASVETELRAHYSSYRNIDSWVGLHAETVPDGERLPPTLKAVLREQFLRLRDCDPMYFKEPRTGVDRAYVNAHGSLRSILLRNTDIAESLLPGADHSLFEQA